MSLASERARAIMEKVNELEAIGVPQYVVEPIKKYARSLNICKHCHEQIEPYGTGWSHSAKDRSGVVGSQCKISRTAEPVE